MSSRDSPKKYQFMVYAPDMTDEGAFQRRLSVREKHLAGAKSQFNSGLVSECLVALSFAT